MHANPCMQMASPNIALITWVSHLALILLFVFSHLELTQPQSLISALNPHYASNNWFPTGAKGSHKGQVVQGLHKIKQYLKTFGYLPSKQAAKALEPIPELSDAETSANDDFDEQTELAIKTYQLNHNLAVTGALDEQTAEMMMMPRCGMPDFIDGKTSMRAGNEVLVDELRGLDLNSSLYKFFFNRNTGQPLLWPRSRRNLRYGLVGRQLVDFSTVGRVMAYGFGAWANAVPQAGFRFSQEYRNPQGADIKIGFFPTINGSPFPNGNSTYAYATAPVDGHMYLNTAVNYGVNQERNKIDLVSLATHEIGHLLGLDHSSIRTAVMWPYIQLGEIKRGLHPDDVNGIRALYR